VGTRIGGGGGGVMNDGIPPLHARAERTLRHIEERFALGGGDYRERGDVRSGPAFAWAHGVLFSAFVAAAAHVDRARYAARARQHFAALRRGYWHRHGPVPGFNASRGTSGAPDRYYDDNAWLVLGLLDAYRLFGEPEYERAARDAMRFVLSGYDASAGGGLFWHEQARHGKHAASTAPAAVAALALGMPVWTRRLYSWLRSTLRDPADGLYWDNVDVRTGRVETTKWSYNSALVLRCELDLAAYYDARVYRDRAVALADACVRRWFDPAAGILRDDAAFAHLLAEALLQTAAATGIRRYREVVTVSLDTLWTRVRRPDGTYPKHWDPRPPERDGSGPPGELLWVASAARAYAFAAPHREGTPPRPR
jgi:rhamnogalacturonyl hydrolase YesR